jgi:hypothetical protein
VKREGKIKIERALGKRMAIRQEITKKKRIDREKRQRRGGHFLLEERRLCIYSFRQFLRGDIYRYK